MSDVVAYKPTIVSIFSGCGGLDLGFEEEGYETIWANDNAEWAVESFKANFGNVIHLKDITKINPAELPDFDLFTGGFPCQPFSQAGYKLGFEDTRGTLFFNVAKIVKEKKPKAVFLENVENLVSHDRGKTLHTIIKTQLLSVN